MSSILHARPVIESLQAQIKKEVLILKQQEILPTLGIIRVGNNPSDIYYENSIIKNCQAVGIETKINVLDVNIDLDCFKSSLEKFNNDKSIHGILVFRPLPPQLDESVIRNLINPGKDSDCMSPLNLEKVFEGDSEGFVPCTPAAVMEVIKYYQIPLAGANVVVVGRSLVVGKPLLMMFLKENSTVTICHSKTKDLEKHTGQADIVVAAIGKAKLFGGKYFGDNSVVLDVGINETEDGNICGDVDFNDVNGKVRAITPVPGGIGSVTTTVLLKHVLMACRKQMNFKL